MGNDVASNGFLRVGIEHSTGATVDLGDNLVGDDNCDAKLIRKMLQRAQELCKMGLPRRKFTTAIEICTVERGR
jgi:hypothetical protein